MKVLFHKKFLEHNVFSEAEGAYRIEDFRNFEDTHANGEEYITLVHTEHYKNWIKEACSHNDYVAEVKLSPESYEAAILAVGLAVKASEQGDFAVIAFLITWQSLFRNWSMKEKRFLYLT